MSPPLYYKINDKMTRFVAHIQLYPFTTAQREAMKKEFSTHIQKWFKQQTNLKYPSYLYTAHKIAQMLDLKEASIFFLSEVAPDRLSYYSGKLDHLF